MLFMSMGITIHKMICLVSGTVTLSLFENEDCCPTEAQGNCNSIETKCCDYSTDYFKLDVRTLISSFQFKTVLIAEYFTMSVFVFPETAKTFTGTVSHSPPLSAGKIILLLISVFRI